MVATSLGAIAAGAAIGMASSAGIAAVKGGSFKDILKSGLIGGATGAAGAGIGGVISGTAGGLLSKVGTAVANVGKEGSKLASVTNAVGGSISNMGTKLTTFHNNFMGNTPSNITNATTNPTNTTATVTPTGATTSTTAGSSGTPISSANATQGIGEASTGAIDTNSNIASTNISNTADKVKLLPKIPTLKSKLPVNNSTGGEVTAGGLNADGSVAASTGAANNTANTANPTANSVVASSAPKTLLNKLKTVGDSKFGQGVKKGLGQYGAQGVLSLLTAGMSAKSAKDANALQEQSLLFQQRTYEEQKQKQESKEAQLKNDAWNAYQSANAFGENLYNKGTNSLLFTKDYKTNPTGSYSVLAGSVTPGLLSGGITKLSDYT